MASLGDLVLIPATMLGIPSLVFCAECLLAAAPRRFEERKRGPRPSVVVLVPAHDEEAGIAATLEALSAALEPGDRLLVVADNCSDATASIARTHGAEVVERTDPERRGKGYALAFGRRALLDAPPEVVIVVDADCRVAPGCIDALARTAAATGRPVQGAYLLDSEGDAAVGAVSALAFLVRNLVRPLGLARMGGPTQLTGSGMAFPFALFARADALGGDLVEDLSLGVALALEGYAPVFSEEARISGKLPRDSGDALGQRRRWEQGQLRSLGRFAHRLIGHGLWRRDAHTLLLGLDLLVPPLSLLLLGHLAVGGLGLVVLVVSGQGAALAITAVSLAAVGLGVGVAWARFGRELIDARRLLASPGYVLGKLPIYAALLARRAETQWVRTRREPGQP